MPLAPPMFPQQAPAAPASPPTGNPGEMAAGMAQVRQSIQLLEAALPKFGIGTKQHEAAINAIKGLSKQFPAQDEAPGVQNTALVALQRQMREGAMMRQLMAQQGGGGGGPPGGGGPMAGAM